MPDNIKYPFQDAIVAFIDVLGFKKIIEGNDKDKINRVLDTLHELEQTEGNFEITPEETSSNTLTLNIRTNIFCFSDSIICTAPLDQTNTECLELRRDEENESILYAIVQSIIKLQIYLLKNGLPSRGGLAKGEMYLSGKKIVGKPYHTALEIEKKAIYPRVVLDPSIKQLSTRLISYAKPPRVKRDFDGFRFINYIEYLVVSAAKSQENFKLMSEIINYVTEQINFSNPDNVEKLEDITIRAKWLWIARQFIFSLQKHAIAFKKKQRDILHSKINLLQSMMPLANQFQEIEISAL